MSLLPGLIMERLCNVREMIESLKQGNKCLLYLLLVSSLESSLRQIAN